VGSNRQENEGLADSPLDYRDPKVELLGA